MIILTNVSKSFGKRKVLEGVTLQINPQEFVCLVGPSGAGKSTLIHLLIGAEAVTSGSVEVDGADLRAIPPPILQLYRRRVGVVFQDYKLIPHRTVAENIAFPLEACGMDDVTIASRVVELLARMHLTAQANALPSALSGGEMARAAIARAIVHRPMVLLLDEPTGNLDPTQSLAMLKLFQEFHRAGTTILLATHDSALVEMLQTRVIELKNGRIVHDAAGGSPTRREVTAKHDLLSASKSPLAKPLPMDVAAPKKKVKVTAIHS